MRKPKEILDEMLDKTNEIVILNKELLDTMETATEWLAVNEIETAIGKARTRFEQRLEKQ